jgi:predicted transcriptional regulator
MKMNCPVCTKKLDRRVGYIADAIGKLGILSKATCVTKALEVVRETYGLGKEGGKSTSSVIPPKQRKSNRRSLRASVKSKAKIKSRDYSKQAKNLEKARKVLADIRANGKKHPPADANI